ncbi:hypothetical protein [Campylobacter upsaliensis]|uniref:hypothetical protein n=2 Tax=Campylobacter upsaliensis TaxID=28080 RepID=UPI00214A1727|nr:hypothetical protein [Campylobacter upsaliensis]MCR2102712.1 hypothetical protein [Campylobacter upsaliensis]MCR2120573.1 hypothetical protein [Campylobacter upsaliensis]
MMKARQMDLYKIAQSVFTEIEAEVNETTKWKSDSKYIKIRYLQIDKRGSFGERLIRDIFAKERNISLIYKDGDQGAWDIQINGIKIEIKTSSLDVNGKFQNESIKDTPECDYICFIGVAPNDLYMRLEKISTINFHLLHPRGERGTGVGYKWDFKPENMQKICTRKEVVDMFYKKMGINKKIIKKNLISPNYQP